MVVDTLDPATADLVFQALADSTRRDIVRRAMNEEHSVSALASRYPMSFAAVQKHVAVLERAGLVTKEPKGRTKLVKTDIETIRNAQRLLDELEEMWRGRIDRLDAIVEDTNEGDRECL